MFFTDEEKKMLVENTKKIFNFLKDEVANNMRDDIYFDFLVRHGEKRLHIHVYKDGSFAINRGFNSCEYCLGDGFKTNYNLYCHGNPYKFFESYDEMFALIKNWQEIKAEIMPKIEKDKEVYSVLKEFEV